MTKVNVTKTIEVSAEAAWSKLSAFSGIENYSPIARSVSEGQGVGMKRSCFLPDDAEIKETLDKLDNETMDLQYSIQSGPCPVTGYVSDVSVKTVGEGKCEISWSAQFNVNEGAPVDEMEGLFKGFYVTIIDSLESLIQSEN